MRNDRRVAAVAAILALAGAWGLCLFLLVQPSGAQPATSPPAPNDQPPAKKATKAPRIETKTLETKDGVLLHVEYRPAALSKGGKSEDAVPVVVLHMAKGSGADWKPLADALQRAGHAVIVPDLRGHGKSTQVRLGGRVGRIDQASMRREDYERMVTSDMETIKRFIIERNNEKELNLQKLVVIGAEVGAAVAINWAALDWSWPPLATGPQGQDVKGLVLLTPVWGYKGMSIVNATKQPGVQRAISTMIIVGSKDSANLNDARRLHQSLERYHEDFSSAPEKVWREQQDLFLITPTTSLQGTKMLGEKSLGVERAILDFIKWRLVDKQIPWLRRDRPLD